MPWRGPSYAGEFPSLGWELLEWYETYLRVPSGPHYGAPLVLTDEQARFIVRWYALDPRGRFVYRRGASRRPKGWGKSPMLAAWAIGALVGPVVFAGWNADGEPVGHPQETPWVQIAACSVDQTDNTYSAVYAMLADSPALDEFRIDLGKTKVFLTDRPGSVIEPVTASAGSREGQPITDAVLDETHLWVRRNGGVKLAATLRRNLSKMNGRSLESTNAFVPGEGSVAEDTHRAFTRGTKGLLYDAVEAPWVEDLSKKRELRKALKIAYGDAAWVKIERIVAEIQDPATDPADARRFYLNQLVAAVDAAVDPHRWDALELPTIDRALNMTFAGHVPDETRVGLGFDGSLSGDATALIGCTESRHIFVVKVWVRPVNADPDWKIPRLEVEEAVADCFDRFDVGRMLCDPPRWQTEIERWAETYGEEVVLLFDTNQPRRMAPACDRFSIALAEGAFTHDGSPVLRAHTLAMVKKKVKPAADDDDGRTRYVFTKGDDRRKIDAGIGAVLAHEAAATMPDGGSEPNFYELDEAD